MSSKSLGWRHLDAVAGNVLHLCEDFKGLLLYFVCFFNELSLIQKAFESSKSQNCGALLRIKY